jgi:polyhydroxyalkanoic acid synthase PhaR subunit
VADQKSPAVDPFAAWRDWLEQTERQLNNYFNQMMGTEQYARLLGQFNDASLNMQKNMSETLARYFSSLNVATREDLATLGQRLNALEQRVTALERSNASAALASSGTGSSASIARPPRTKKPPSNEGKQT